MATITPTKLEFNTLTGIESTFNFSVSDVIDCAGYLLENLSIAIVSEAEAGEKSLVLTFKKGIGVNAVADQVITVAPAELKIISGFEAARLMNKDGNIDVSAALSSTGSGGALSDYDCRAYLRR